MRVLLKDAKNPNGRLMIPVSVNVRQVDDVNTNDGEVIYVLEFICGAIDHDGNRIETVIIDNVSEEDVKDQIERGLSIIGAQVPWPNQQEDEYAPRIIEVFPQDESKDVPINSHIYGTLRDYFPTSGIDPSTIKIRVNGIDVTDEARITGEETQYRFRWIPTIKYPNSD